MKVDLLSKKIQKVQKQQKIEEPIMNQPIKKGRKITIKIERGDKVVIGSSEKQKVIDFILLDRNEIKQKGEEELNRQIQTEFSKLKLRKRQRSNINNKSAKLQNGKSKSNSLVDIDDENSDMEIEKKVETVEISDDEDNNNNNNNNNDVEQEAGHIDKEDVEAILRENKKITQIVRPFLCQELENSIDPRQNKLVYEIQHILSVSPEQKLNLILDLDETLVNSIWVSNENEQLLENQFRYKMPSNKNILTIYYNNNEGVQKEFITIMRPHLKEFMVEVKKYFNVHVYSHGRKEYVYKLLDKIDPRRDLFNRNAIFKNEGQVNLKTQKDIKNIINCKNESDFLQVLKQTIIIDDIYEVWLEETLKNVVPIKRFQPLNDYLKKINSSTIFVNHNKQYIRFPKSHQEYFEDKDINDESNQFLKGLQRYLISTALQYYNKKLIKQDSNVDVRKYLAYQKCTIMSKLDINISLLEGDEIYDVFKYIALAMGAQIELKQFRYALVNKKYLQNLANKMATMKVQNPNLIFLNAQWLVDSFFINYQLDIQNYIL